MDVISHGDDAAMMSAIDAAIEEVQGYLTKYDTGKIFAARGKERNPILLLFVKDIAAWHFCNICNAGVDIEMREKRYDRAIEWLRNNQNRQNPNLPAAPERPGQQECRHCGEIAFGSNRKRDNHF
nr:MAG TPA: head to tail adaptor [Caudoviricetes sp.]